MTPEQIDDIIKNNPDWDFIIKPAPHDTSCWVKINAIIRENTTGEVRVYETDGIWDKENNAPALWIWEDGNFSCDCNRRLFFWRANGEYETEKECCGSGAFNVNIQNPKTGEIIYKEFDSGGKS